jgi:hypothetical protein
MSRVYVRLEVQKVYIFFVWEKKMKGKEKREKKRANSASLTSPSLKRVAASETAALLPLGKLSLPALGSVSLGLFC